MQSLTSLKPPKLLRNPITWGALAMAFALVVSIVLAMIYFNPPGRTKTFAFYTEDAASIRPGDEVRMAGITVGSVKDLSLEPNRIRVLAQVNNGAFVGDQSQVEVRMLTVVGGYYVSLISIGDQPLGSEAIPLQRVTMPYSLIRALTDTTKVTENVDTKPIAQSLSEMQKGLTGTNIEAISAAIDAGNSLISTIDKQRGQVTAILDLSKEYIRALNDYRDELARLVRKVSMLTQSLTLYSKGLLATLDGLGEVMMALRPVGNFYENHRVRFVEKVRQYSQRVRYFVERNGATVRALHRVQNLFERILDAQDARPALLSTDLCIPISGSLC